MNVSSETYCSEEEVSGRLQTFEERHDLLQYQFDNWCVWPVLRFSVSRALQTLPLDQAAGGLFSRSEMLPLAARDVGRMLWIRHARHVVKTYSSYHSELEQGRRKDVFFDELLKQTGDHFKIEVINSRKFNSADVPHLIPRDISTVALGIIGDRLTRRYPVKGLDQIAAALSRCLRLDLGLDGFTTPYIARVLSGFHRSKQVYRALLRRIRPRALLLAEVGDYPITAAARELGIHVIEFQHGMFHRHYPANSWTRYALPYKPGMPLPDRVFLYGPHWQRELSINGFWREELRSVGNLRVDAYRRQPATLNGEVCTLAVTLQGTDTARLIEFFAEFLRLAEGRLPLRLAFKMHPVYQTTDQQFVEAFGSDRRVVVVSAASQPSTFELLKQSHFHLSIYSTCHYEALALGVPTVVLPFTGVENVMSLVEAGHALLARSPPELVEIALRWRQVRVLPGVGEAYFTPDAMGNMLRELASLPGRVAS